VPIRSTTNTTTTTTNTTTTTTNDYLKDFPQYDNTTTTNLVNDDQFATLSTNALFNDLLQSPLPKCDNMTINPVTFNKENYDYLYKQDSSAGSFGFGCEFSYLSSSTPFNMNNNNNQNEGNNNNHMVNPSTFGNELLLTPFFTADPRPVSEYDGMRCDSPFSENSFILDGYLPLDHSSSSPESIPNNNNNSLTQLHDMTSSLSFAYPEAPVLTTSTSPVGFTSLPEFSTGLDFLKGFEGDEDDGNSLSSDNLPHHHEHLRPVTHEEGKRGYFNVDTEFPWEVYVRDPSRVEKIKKWKNKKYDILTGKHEKKTYAVRRRVADHRLRVGGRFVSKAEQNKLLTINDFENSYPQNSFI